MKVVLLVVGGIVAVIIAACAGGWWWWSSNQERLMQEAHQFTLAGQKIGPSLTEGGCVARAIDRHGRSENRSFVKSVHTSLFLRACLDESQPEPKFCEGIPSKDEIAPYALWTAQTCTNLGFSDYYCSHIVGMIPEYCASPKRSAKNLKR